MLSCTFYILPKKDYFSFWGKPSSDLLPFINKSCEQQMDGMSVLTVDACVPGMTIKRRSTLGDIKQRQDLT